MSHPFLFALFSSACTTIGWILGRWTLGRDFNDSLESAYWHGFSDGGADADRWSESVERGREELMRRVDETEWRVKP